MLNVKNTRLWIKALESGEYKQINGVLMNNYGPHLKFCCLGVLCDLYSQKVTGFFDETGDFIAGFSSKKDSDFQDETVGGFKFEVDPRTNYAPYVVAKWVGLPSRLQGIFSTLNDDVDATFNEIAGLLRRALAYQHAKKTFPPFRWWAKNVAQLAAIHGQLGYVLTANTANLDADDLAN